MTQISKIYLTILVILVVMSAIDAKRGCNAFGHACFGGHGKRSEIPGPDSGSNETPYPIFKLLQDTNKIPNEVNYNSGSYNSPPVEELEFRFTVYELFKNWLDDYRRVHQANNLNNNLNNNNNNNNANNDMDFPVNNKNMDNRNFK